MKIFINAFWGGFVENIDPNKFFVFQKIFEEVFNEKIEVGNIDESDILFESCFSDRTFINYKKWKYTFFFNGESTKRIASFFQNNNERIEAMNKFDCILTGRFTNKEKRIVNMPLFLVYIYSNNYLNNLLNPVIYNHVPTKKICAVISNGNSSKRNYILDMIGKRINIDYAGNFRNNVPKVNGTYNSDDILNFYSQYKFVICMENEKQETYITEKIVNGFLSKTIPVFWGSNYVINYFNEKRFINISNIHPYVINNAINRMLSIINDDNKYLEVINQPIFKDNKLNITDIDVIKDIKSVLFE